MKYALKTALFLAVTSLTAIVMLSRSMPVHAASAFDSTDLIDDSVFDNTATMTFPQIDSWINANFPSSCISTNNGFQAPDPTGYSPSGGFTYGGNVSAGHVIYDAALAYGLNPQVLLVTMQKEQSLVSGGGGCSTESYAAAMGYGCPDGGTTYNYSGVDLYSINGVEQTSINGTCVNGAAQVGFSQQVIHAAWLLKFGEQRSQGNTSFDVSSTNYPESGDSWDNSDDPGTCYEGPMTQGTYNRCSGGTPTYYDGYTTIDGVSTYMGGGATAALYWYTPHFSGNENFDNIWASWFGSVYGGAIGTTAYRLYNSQYNDHYFTAIDARRQDAILYQGYSNDGVAFPVSSTQGTGEVPVYALYNGEYNDHWLTVDGLARYWAINYGGYRDDGVAFYAYPTVANATSVPSACPSGSSPVYALWNSQYHDHFYTIYGPERYWVFIYAGYRDDTSATYQDAYGNGYVDWCSPNS